MWFWDSTIDPVGTALQKATKNFVPHRGRRNNLWADPQLDNLEDELFRVTRMLAPRFAQLNA